MYAGMCRVIYDRGFIDSRRFSLIFWCEGVLTIIIGSLGVIGHIFSIGILTSRWAQEVIKRRATRRDDPRD